MKKILLICLLFCVSQIQAQTTVATKTKYTSWFGVPTLDTPPLDVVGGINFYPTVNKLGYRNNTVNQFLTTESYVSTAISTALASYAPITGGTGYIQNQNSVAQSATFRIANTGQVQGNFAVGTTLGVSTSLLNSKNLEGGTTVAGYNLSGTIQSGVTVAAYGYRSSPSTAAGSYTVPDLANLIVIQGSLGAGSSVTRNYGLWVQDLTFGVSNYGVRSGISSGTNKWNIYADGNAKNYLLGNVGIGADALDLSKLLVKPSNDGHVGLKIITNSATQTADLLMVEDNSSNIKLSVKPSGLIYYPAIATGNILKTLPDGTVGAAVSNTDYLPVNNSALTGVSTAQTAAPGTNTTQIATTQFTTTAIGNAVSAYTPTARTITTTFPLTGGGDLSANRVLGADTTSLGLATKPFVATSLIPKANLSGGNSFTGIQSVSGTDATGLAYITNSGSGHALALSSVNTSIPTLIVNSTGGGSLASFRASGSETSSIGIDGSFNGRYHNFNRTTSLSYLQGRLAYDGDNESLTFYNNDANVSLQIGQENWIRVVNNTGSTIANGSAVYINGSSAGLPTIALAQANSGTTTVGVGLATESIANGATGFVTSLGLVNSLNTSGFAIGAVYISPTVAGGLTQTVPTDGNYRYRVGFVTSVDASVGKIHVTPSVAVRDPITSAQSVDFANAAVNQGDTQTVTINGAAVGDIVTIAVPDAIQPPATWNGAFIAWVSAANTVKIKFSNNDPLAPHNLAAATIVFKVFKQ